MSVQLYENLLKSLKSANKDRKLKLANSNGYETVEEYKTFLESNIITTVEFEEEVIEKEITIIPTIHIVDIIDCSGSMRGDKINNAVKGINDGITKLREEEGVNYTYTICDFSEWRDINFKYVQEPLSNISNIKFNSRGTTALYDAIGKSLTKLKAVTDKVLVNIYTDGEENDSKEFKFDNISALIEELKSNFTVTFIGTDRDVKFMIKKMKLDETNTLKYDGSAKGLAETMTMNSVARSAYTSSVIKGEDVSTGFYKNIKK